MSRRLSARRNRMRTSEAAPVRELQAAGFRGTDNL